MDSMPLVLRKSSLILQKQKAEATPEKEPKRLAKAPAKLNAVVVVKKGADPLPKSLMKGRVAEVDSSSLRPSIYKQLTFPAMLPALQSFAKPRKPGFIERSKVEVPEVL